MTWRGFGPTVGRNFQLGPLRVDQLDMSPPPNQQHDAIVESLGKTFEGVDPTNVSPQQLYMLLYTIRAQQIVGISEMRKFRQEFETYKESQEDMMKTWETSGNVLNFIKALAAIGTALGVVIAGILVILKGIGVPFK